MAAGAGGDELRHGKTLAELVGERQRLFPASGEINRALDPAAGGVPAVLARVQRHYQARARSIEFIDGLSMEFDRWRFNLRGSNTEPLVRLNVESRGDEALMQAEDRGGAAVAR